MSAAAINQFEVSYARFNAVKTFTTSVPSRFQHTQFGELVVTRDHARPDSYYNRILGVAGAHWNDVGPAIGWITADVEQVCAMRIDTQEKHECQDLLRGMGFRHTDTIVWLHAPDRIGARPEPDDDLVRLLTRKDRPSLRQLLEAQGPIDDDLWRLRRDYLCTNTFRWFGVFDQQLLVSAASVWIDTAVAIFGSAFTLAPHRGRGYQQRLLEHRRHATPGAQFVDVAPDSTSHRNCIRAGFVELERRQVWTREPLT